MIDTDRQPEDCYTPASTDPDAVERLARRSMSITGTPQRLHAHAAGERCGPSCRLLEPSYRCERCGTVLNNPPTDDRPCACCWDSVQGR